MYKHVQTRTARPFHQMRIGRIHVCHHYHIHRFKNPAGELDPCPNRTQRFGLISIAEMAAPNGTEQKDEEDDVQLMHYPHIMYGTWCYAIGLPMERY